MKFGFDWAHCGCSSNNENNRTSSCRSAGLGLMRTDMMSNLQEPKRLPQVVPARIHLIAAKEAPVVVAIRRKPSKLVHILRWNTETDEVESGTWFQYTITPERCDLSFDGQFFIYLANFATGSGWTGICRPPDLHPIIHWPPNYTHGGGLFLTPNRLEVFESTRIFPESLHRYGIEFPFEFTLPEYPGEKRDFHAPINRLYRDGFRSDLKPDPDIDVWGKEFRRLHREAGSVFRPTPDHPVLRVRSGTYGSINPYLWDVPEIPGLLDEHVHWATYDSLGQLLFSRLGVLYRCTLADLLKGETTSSHDLESLEPPPMPHRSSKEIKTLFCGG